MIWGDTSTNVLASTGFTGIYRVDTFAAFGGLTGTNGPIMFLKLHLAAPPSLTEGTYWLSWSAACSSPNIPDAPCKVLPGRLNPPGQQARQLYAGTWYYATDSGKSMGMNMIIKAKAGLTAVSDLNKKAGVEQVQNNPNPFNGTTDITFRLAEAGHATLSVYNVIGQRVATLIDGSMDAGKHHCTFNTDNLPSGTYYYKLVTAHGYLSRQMVLIK